MQLVRMRHCRPQHESRASAFHSLKRDRRLASLENYEFAVRQPLAVIERAPANRDPRHGVTGRRFIRPALTGSERDQHVVDPAWSPHRARGCFVRTDDEAGRTNSRHQLSAEVLAFWFSAFEFRRKGDPQLEALHHGR
jgi:hypothetical protein